MRVAEQEYRITHFPGGPAFQRFSVPEIKRQIILGGKAYPVQRRALEIVAGVPGHAQLGELQALWEWFRPIQFRQDPYALEKIESASRALAEIDQGYGYGTDRDGFVILGGSMLRALGYPVQLVRVGSQPGRYEHIYLEAWLPYDERWIPWDPALPGPRILGRTVDPRHVKAITRDVITAEDEQAALAPQTHLLPGAVGDVSRIVQLPAQQSALVEERARSYARGIELTMPGVEEQEEYSVDVAPDDDGIELTMPGVEEEEDWSVDVASPEIEEGLNLTLPGTPAHHWFIDIAEDEGDDAVAKGIDAALPKALSFDPVMVRQIIQLAADTEQDTGPRVNLIRALVAVRIAMMSRADAEKIALESLDKLPRHGLSGPWNPITDTFSFITDSWVGETIRGAIQWATDLLGPDLGPIVNGIVNKALATYVLSQTGNYQLANLLIILLEDLDGVDEYINYVLATLDALPEEVADSAAEEAGDRAYGLGEELGFDVQEMVDEAWAEIQLVREDVENTIAEARRNLEEHLSEARRRMQEAIDQGLKPLQDVIDDFDVQASYFEDQFDRTVDNARTFLDSTIETHASMLEQASFPDAQTIRAMADWETRIREFDDQAREQLEQVRSEVMEKARLGIIPLEEAERRYNEMREQLGGELQQLEEQARDAIEEEREEAQRLHDEVMRKKEEQRKVWVELLGTFFAEQGEAAQQALEQYLRQAGQAGWHALVEETIARGDDPGQLLIDKGIDRAGLRAALREHAELYGLNISLASDQAALGEEGEVLAWQLLRDVEARGRGIDDLTDELRDKLVREGVLNQDGSRRGSNALEKGLNLTWAPELTEEEVGEMILASDDPPEVKESIIHNVSNRPVVQTRPSTAARVAAWAALVGLPAAGAYYLLRRAGA